MSAETLPHHPETAKTAAVARACAVRAWRQGRFTGADYSSAPRGSKRFRCSRISIDTTRSPVVTSLRPYPANRDTTTTAWRRPSRHDTRGGSMTTDLWMLVYTALLSMFFFFAYLPGRAAVPGGLAWAFGNRE